MIEFDENLNPIEGGKKPEGAQTPPPENPFQGEPTQSFTPPPPPPQRPASPAPTPMPPRQPLNRGGFGFGLLWVVVIGLMIITIVSIAVAGATSSNPSSSNQTEGITVTGEGIAYASPDIAKIRVGVQYTARNLSDAKDRLDDKIDKILDALDDINIDDDDIKTVEYSTYPETDYRYSPARITGYTGRHSLEVTIRDLDDINDVVEELTDAGATEVGDITFDFDDADEWIDEAREEAIDEAKDRAESIADQADIKLGKLVSIQEYVSGVNEPTYYYGRGGGGEAHYDTNIEPGSQEIRVNVTLIYEIG